jgi:hypothetical protein
MRSKSVSRAASSYSNDFHANTQCCPLGLTELLASNREVVSEYERRKFATGVVTSGYSS